MTTATGNVKEFPQAKRTRGMELNAYDRTYKCVDEGEAIIAAAKAAVDMVHGDGTITVADITDPEKASDMRRDYMIIIDTAEEAIKVARPKFSISQATRREVNPAAVAYILKATGAFKWIKSADGETQRVIMRQDEGDNAGTYATQYKDRCPELLAVVKALVPTASEDYAAKVLASFGTLEKVEETRDTRRVWFADGVVDLDDGLAFTPYNSDEYAEKYGNQVRLSKLAVKWNENATNPVITEAGGWKWDIEQQIREVFTNKAGEVDEMAVKGWWQFLSFVVRGCNGRKTLLLQNAEGLAGGKNGKSTLLANVRAIIGKHRVKNVKIEDIEERFALAGLDRFGAIISDESNAATDKITKSATLKRLVSGEAVEVEGKGKDIYSVEFGKPMAFAINGYLKAAAKDDAFFERFLVFPFEHTFSTIRPQVMDYVTRADVVEYVANKALREWGHLETYTADVVEHLDQYKQEMRTNSSNVYKMMADIEPLLIQWAERNEAGYIIPEWVLYAIFTDKTNGWAAQNGVGSVLQASNFRQELTVWVNDSKRWTRYDPAKLCQITGDKKAAKELLEQYPIEELQAKGWEYDLRGIQWEEYRCYLSQDARRKRRRGGIIWRGVD